MTNGKSDVLCFSPQQSHWPSHMGTCSQNQSNQEEESSNDHGVDPTAAAAAQAQSHFLAGQEAALTSRQARNVANQQALQVRFFPPLQTLRLMI